MRNFKDKMSANHFFSEVLMFIPDFYGHLHIDFNGINFMKIKFNRLIASLLALTCVSGYSQSEWSRMEKNILIQQPKSSEFLRSSVSPSPIAAQSTTPLPDAGITVENPLQIKDAEGEFTSKRILKPGECLVFEINDKELKEDSSALEILSEDIENAIARVPAWLRYDLKFKFRNTEYPVLRTQMVNLINQTPKRYLDEVAYQLTYLPTEVLKDSRFINTWDWLVKNVELIYTHADSLKYVRLVEHGDTASGDWYTTTEYKIRQNGQYIWREIDRYYYYMFIVMPKIEQEGVYVTDKASSTGQRTWGYGWREYLWSDPDSTHSYRPVGISGYKVVSSSGTYDTLKVDSVPRFGEIMQMPEYLWDEQTGIWFFLRDFKASDHALNVLGNWCSRCIPMDVTSSDDYRPSQPNQIAWKHVGNCHEDALLVAAAARTALIPLMHIGDFCDDHVWGMMHDGGDSLWHHFEFFRGGCSPSRPYYWGMTNMQPNGNYGWNSSLVQGYVPDGTLFNVSDYYTEKTPASYMELTITDADGKPVDGARVNLYSTNYQYSASNPYVMSAGYLWSDANGKIRAKLGSGNKYYMKISHPKYGSFPEESGRVYVMIKDKTVAGKSYKINYKFSGTAKRSERASAQEVFASDKGLKLNLSARNLTVGSNPVDGQLSSFCERTGYYAGLNVYVANAAQYAEKDSALYSFKGLANGSFDIPLPKEGKSYVIVANDRNLTNYVEVSYSASLTSAGNFDITGLQETDKEVISIYPNPANDRLYLQTESPLCQADIYSTDGRLVKTSLSNEIGLEGMPAGMYLIRVKTNRGCSVMKFVKQ